MLSILIPVYNYNVYPLVVELQKQCMECGIVFEILCQDDASKSNLNVFNENVNSFLNCSFIALEQNVAHRENRNLLAAKAQYEYLLYIDGDSVIIRDNYVQSYIANLNNFDVIYGGRLHPEKCPSQFQELRWKYGRFVEDKSAVARRKNPYQSLLFNNTIIKKTCFNKVKFDPILKKYGHDDTQFSFQLSVLKISICHLENPVEHGDIDFNVDYIVKTKKSLENLIILYSQKKIDTEFVRLLKIYDLFKKTKSTFIIAKIYSIFEKIILLNLQGLNPNLFVFNIFRLGYFCKQIQSKNL